MKGNRRVYVVLRNALVVLRNVIQGYQIFTSLIDTTI